MNPVPVDEPSLLAKAIAWAVLAGTGGAVKFVSAALKSKEFMSTRRFTMLLIANVFISGFCGLMGALMFSTFSTDRTWQLIAAGVFGYLSTQGLDIIILSTIKKSTIDPVPASAVIPIPASVDPAAFPKP